MRFRDWTGWALLLLLAWSGGIARAQSALIRDSSPPDLALVFTGDVIGYLDPCG